MVWTLTRGTETIVATVIEFRQGGAELKLHCNGIFSSGNQCYDRANAVVLARKVRGDYLSMGWPQ